MRLRLFSILGFFALPLASLFATAQADAQSSNANSSWQSVVTGTSLRLDVLAPDNVGDAAPPLVFYLQNLAAPRVGTDTDDLIIHDLRKSGHLVVLLDYAKHDRARVPFINRDLAKLRDDLLRRRLLADRRFDSARVFIVPSGHRLTRDIVFYRDDKRTLALDLIYPSGHPASPVGTVLEFSCDNKDRMGNYSLSACSDTLLDGFATEGFAVAMADHPMPAPYKGIDAMPASAWKIKAAVRTLRVTACSLGLGERIVPVGFSRGSGMALMLLTTENRAEFDGRGEHPDVSSAVQGAVLMSGRFTYLDLRPDDHIIPRYNQVWGTREKALPTWRAHGALDYLGTATKPVFLTINATESPDALHQMTVLRKRLAELGNDEIFMLEREARGHKVALDPDILAAMNTYLKRRLSAD
jgi:hypothetical protein